MTVVMIVSPRRGQWRLYDRVLEIKIANRNRLYGRMVSGGFSLLNSHFSLPRNKKTKELRSRAAQTFSDKKPIRSI